MNITRRLTLAAAAGAVLLCVVAACSSGGGAKGQGALGNLAGPSSISSVGATLLPNGQPTVNPTVHRSSTPTTNSTPPSAPPSSAGSPGSPAPVLTRVFTFHPISDFGVATTGNCYWSILYNSGENDLEVGVEFTISYSGLLSGTTTKFDVTPAIGGFHSISDPAYAGTHIYYVGAGTYSSSPYLGQNVKVTGTITAPDTNSGDDTASITVAMPTLQTIENAGITAGVDHQVSCG